MTLLAQLQRAAHRRKVVDNGLSHGTSPTATLSAGEFPDQVGRERGGAVKARQGGEAVFSGGSGNGRGRAFRHARKCKRAS